MEITKGNWEVSDSGFVRYSTFGRTTTGARKFVVNADIGIIAEAQGDTQEEADANANLIAAAPRLYTELKYIYDHILSFIEVCNDAEMVMILLRLLLEAVVLP